MPNFFNKHKDTSPPMPAPAVQEDESPITMPIPQVTSPDVSPAASEQGSVPTIPPVIAFSAGSDKDLDGAKKLDSAFRAVANAQNGFHAYKGTSALGIVNKSGDMLTAIKTDVANVQSMTSPLKSAYESEAMKTIRSGVNALVDSLPGLITALDEVAKLHPFIGIAVGAFKVVVELDLKRRDNDKKIASLFLEMKDMMEALLQLDNIKDRDAVGPGGMTIEARMQNLVKQTADDITACGNACDTYAKKRLIVKVVKGSVWEGTLKTYIDIFAKRRKDFTFALAIHTGMGVDDANRKLNTLDHKIDTILEFFATAVSPEQQEMAALVQRKGGPTAVMGNPEALSELLKFKPTAVTTAMKRGEREGQQYSSHTVENDLESLRVELFESPAVAIRNNLEVFERKLKMQQREFAEEMRGMVHHQGDRIIDAVTSGPHDRIIDPDIHEIWKEMRWRGHVKARHFVLALRDYYRQQIEIKKRARGENLVINIHDDDEWALEWININRLQAIAEAFDDDASGFITIAEVNQFTSSRPKDWRQDLLHWLAYWAIGWQMTATYYRDKVIELLAKMFSMRPRIHNANIDAVQKYLLTVYRRVTTVTSSFICTYQSDSLKARFQSYVDSEEQRIREGLETVRYDIDAMDTLTLITGPGRIEKSLFPLLYLLLKRDFEIFRLCQKMIIHKDELWDAADTITWVFDAVVYRHNDLEALFKQQRLDPVQQFKSYANELFDYWHDDSKFTSLENLRELEWTEFEYVEENEEQNVDSKTILNYPSAVHNLYNIPEDIVSDSDALADNDVKSILGRWNGLIGAERWPVTAIVSFCFHASADPNTYEASDVAAHGTGYTLHGGYTKKDDGTIEYNFSRTYIARLRKTYFTGTLDEDDERLSGSWGYSETDKPYRFIFWKNVPPETLIARPPPSEFEENKTKALWKYALTAVHNEVRRKMFSWSYLKERRAIRKEYLELLEHESNNLTTVADLDRFAELDRTATCEDVRCFYVLSDYQRRSVPTHLADCDNCAERIHGARMICIQCRGKDTLDFCDKPACRDANKTRDDITQPHVPTHAFVKVRTVLNQTRDIGKLLRMSDAGLERARKLLDSSVQAGTSEPTSENNGTELKTETKKVEGPREEADAAGSGADTKVAALTCVSCSSEVSYPCWYCIDCPGALREPSLFKDYANPELVVDANVFVCLVCDEKNGGMTVGDHLDTHSLVSCKLPVVEDDKDKNTEQRLSDMEGKLATLTAQMERIERLLQSLAVSRAD
ncbi:hypothetical protein GY45DRAFT_1276344 [Cubamyces sp. BRFM 1775]|nr:hypothetical protein GY45DRAFT_1276344 [Cubamyces sp. BRFM 1775]